MKRRDHPVLDRRNVTKAAPDASDVQQVMKEVVAHVGRGEPPREPHVFEDDGTVEAMVVEFAEDGCGLTPPPIELRERNGSRPSLPTTVVQEGEGGRLSAMSGSVLEQVKDLGADVLGVDWSIELSRAIDVVGTDKVVQGNLDPIALFAPAGDLERRARAIVEAGRRARGHIFNLGHGISRHTDPDAVARLVAAVHAD